MSSVIAEFPIGKQAVSQLVQQLTAQMQVTASLATIGASVRGSSSKLRSLNPNSCSDYSNQVDLDGQIISATCGEYLVCWTQCCSIPPAVSISPDSLVCRKFIQQESLSERPVIACGPRGDRQLFRCFGNRHAAEVAKCYKFCDDRIRGL